jgi:predicted alpha/beta-fold hydrolase
MSADEREFEPHPFLRDAHAMTLAGLLPRGFFGSAREKPLPRGSDTRVRVDAGSELRVWLHAQERAHERPLALLLHGLSGSADSHYVLGLGARLYARGFSVARMNMRNCGESEEHSDTFYCTAQSGDVLAALRDALARTGSECVHVCGW